MGRIMGLWKALMWILLVPVLGIQVMVMIGISLGKQMGITLLVIASVLLAAAAVLFGVLRKKKGIAMLVATVAAVLFIVFAITVYNTFKLNFGVTDVSGGISAFDFVYRHISPLLVVLFMLFYWICWRAWHKEELRREEEAAPSHYLDLGDFTLGRLDDEPLPEAPRRSLFGNKKKR